MADFERLIDELKRRRVFRTAAGYLAAAFVILQVADLTFEPLGLPAGAYRGLVAVAAAGFPVALVLSWFFDIRGQHAGARLRAQAKWALALFVLVCSGFMSYGVVRHWNRADYGSARTIAVLPFKVIGGAELAYLESGLVEMVSRNIDGAANLRAIAPDMVLTYAKEKSATAPTDELAGKLAARYLVSGNISQAGSRLRISATLRDVDKSSDEQLIVEGTSDSLFNVVDRLSAQILAATRKGQDAQLSQSAAVTTGSLPALRKYLDGEEKYRLTHYDSAATAFAEAVAIDSTFALAYYRQAIAYLNQGNYEPARDAIDRGIRHGARLPKREQALLDALNEVFSGRIDQAEQRYRSLLAQHPGDMEATYLLAQTLYYYNFVRGRSALEAEPLLTQVAGADPEFLCPI